MAFIENKVTKAIEGLFECSICLTTYTDPRILSCFHTSCLRCLEGMQSKSMKKPGDVLPCPLCRRDFRIPPEGMIGLQKNSFIENLIEITKAINSQNENTYPCNTCRLMTEDSETPEATMRCLNCSENYCSRCSKMHTSQKLTRDHRIVELSRTLSDDEIRNMFPTRNCQQHSDRVLDYYCSDCKIVVCVSCFVEDHQNHKCKDVKTIDKDFRRKLEENCAEVLAFMGQLESKKMDIERKRENLQTRLLKAEDKIKIKSEQMKTLVEQHTQNLLDELSTMRQKHEKIIMIEFEEIERQMTVLESFVAFCSELKSKGSPNEVCGSAENLITRSCELKEGLEEYLAVPSKSVVIEFTATDEKNLLRHFGNFTGRLSESVKEYESYAIVIGRSDGDHILNEIIKVNLNQSADVSNLPPVPTEMKLEAAAAVYCKSLFVTGIGRNWDEIWKFDETSSRWYKCASLIRGRRRHSVAFVEHVLYICGGYVDADKSAIDDVEAYDAINDKCSTVGKLKYAVRSSGNCVPFKDSLYIFGGYDVRDEVLSSVHVYNAKLNSSSVLSKPMPTAEALLRAVLWNNSVILLGCFSCFIYNFDTETWQNRDRFKTGVFHFGLAVANAKIFVIGGGRSGKRKWKCRDDIRCVPVMNVLHNKPIDWQHHGKMTRPSLVQAFGEIRIIVKMPA